MQSILKNRPIVLVFAGHDPAGGAGVQADTESIGQCGCRALSVITLLTVQDSMAVFDYYSQPIEQFKQQAAALFSAHTFAAIKIGAIADPKQVAAIIALCARFPTVPLILDPVVCPTSGPRFASEKTIKALKKLLARVYLFTPNMSELVYYTGTDQVEHAAAILLQAGCENVLVTSAYKEKDTHTHLLYSKKKRHVFNAPTLAGQYRGSGCIFSAAIAAYLAHGFDIKKAIQRAQDYVTQTLTQAESLGKDIFIPVRIFK